MGFIRIDMELFTNPKYSSLSSDAKLFFGLLENRHSLSEMNGDAWKNKEGKTFVYFPQKEVMKQLGVGHDKVTKITRELQNVGLIKSIPQGLGKPHMIIVNDVFQSAEHKRSAQRIARQPGCDISASNNTDSIINPELIQINPPLPRDRRLIETVLKANINYDALCADLTVAYLDSIIDLMVDTMCSHSDTIIIGGIKRSLIDICERFLALDDLHIRYVYGVFMKQETEVRSPRGFLLKLLYDAPWAAALA